MCASGSRVMSCTAIWTRNKQEQACGVNKYDTKSRSEGKSDQPTHNTHTRFAQTRNTHTLFGLRHNTKTRFGHTEVVSQEEHGVGFGGSDCWSEMGEQGGGGRSQRERGTHWQSVSEF